MIEAQTENDIWTRIIISIVNLHIVTCTNPIQNGLKNWASRWGNKIMHNISNHEISPMHMTNKWQGSHSKWSPLSMVTGWKFLGVMILITVIIMLEQVFWACPPIGLKVKPDESRPHTYPQSLLSGIGLKPSTYTPEQSDLSDKTWDRPKPTVRVYKSDQITWNIGI